MLKVCKVMSPNLTIVRHPYSEPPVSLIHFPQWNQLKYFSNHLTKHGKNPCGWQKPLVLLSGWRLQVENIASDPECRIAMLFDGKQSLAAYLHVTGFLPKRNQNLSLKSISNLMFKTQAEVYALSLLL